MDTTGCVYTETLANVVVDCGFQHTASPPQMIESSRLVPSIMLSFETAWRHAFHMGNIEA